MPKGTKRIPTFGLSLREVSLNLYPQSLKPLPGRIRAPELFQALRGIWTLGGQELVLDIDQETGELMASTYEGKPVDPMTVIARGVQVRAFTEHPIGH